MTHAQRRATPSAVPDAAFRSPQISDGVRLWEIAKASKVLDVNSGYSYLLWCRDFHSTSIVAETAGEVVGFVTGFVRPDAPHTLFVWQVAVDEHHRGGGRALTMLHRLLDRLAPLGISHLETTVSPDNTASIAMFTALARDRGAAIAKRNLFAPNLFPREHGPGEHEAEDLYVIGPLPDPEGQIEA